MPVLFRAAHPRVLDLDCGTDFDTQVVVKTNVADVLRRELHRRSWQRETVALGTNTDPYQRAEGRYALMPGIIGALADSGTPFSILTKGTLLRRDLPLIADAAKRVDVSVAVSLAVGDAELHKEVEPGTPSPQARLGLIAAIRDAGLDCHVMVAPVLPRLTDSVEHLDDLLGRIAAAGATGVTVFALHLRGSTRGWFMSWLARSHPELVAEYRECTGAVHTCHRTTGRCCGTGRLHWWPNTAGSRSSAIQSGRSATGSGRGAQPTLF